MVIYLCPPIKMGMNSAVIPGRERTRCVSPNDGVHHLNYPPSAPQ
jgi:hypothetical protein